MKKLYSILLLSCLLSGMYASTKELDPATVLADTMYAAYDYTVPSYTAFLIAKFEAKKTPRRLICRTWWRK